MGRSSLSPKLLLLLLLLALLLLAPPLLIQARELGARRGGSGGSSRNKQHAVAGLPLIRMLPEPSEDDDGEVPPKLTLDALTTPGVSRPGGLAPPAPKPSDGPQPLHEHEPSSSHGVSGREGQAPPAPEGNTPPHYRRPGPAADVLRVFRDALARFLDWIAA